MRSNRFFILPDYLFSVKGKLYKGKPVPPLKDVLNDICFREAFFGKEKHPGYNLYLPEGKQLEFYEKYGEFGMQFLTKESMNLTINLKFYLEYGGLNYIFGKGLSQDLKDVDLNISWKFINKDLTFYLELPEARNGKDLKSFIHMRQFENYKIFSITLFNDDFSSENFPLYLTKNHNLDDILNISEYSIKLSIPMIKHIFNSIIYLTSENAIIEFEKNEYPKKKAKQKYFDDHFTKRSWFFVGRDWHTKHNPRGPMKCGEFGVRSHYRWQACGPGWQDHKLVYIDQQIRNKDN